MTGQILNIVPQRQPAQQPKKFEAKGHDVQLQDAQYGAKECTVRLIGIDQPVIGVICRRDRYTITLRSSSGDDTIYFKHAIESIFIERSARNQNGGV